MKNKLMKFLAFLILLPSVAFAQAGADCWTGGLMLGNNKYLCAYSANGQSNVKILKADSSGNIELAVGALESPTDLVITVDSDAQRLYTLGASSDTAFTFKFGDGGTTAVQILTISPSTADADDDGSLILAGGGAAGGTRGASITLPGEEVSGGGDITYNAAASDSHIFQVNGTTVSITDSNGISLAATANKLNSDADLIFQTDADPQRLLTFGASSDTALTQTFGDGTASQLFYISGTTSDAADTQSLCLTGGGLCNSAGRGGYLFLSGADVGGANSGGVTLNGVANIRFTTTQNDTLALTLNTSQAAIFAGAVTSTATGSLGWSVVAGANTACTTTCTGAAVFGQNTDAAGIIVGPSDATADVCVCAGAS